MLPRHERNLQDLLDSGEWDDGATKWELWPSSEHPDNSLCTAVGLVAITNVERNEIVLARSERGWGIIAGHVEPGETPDRATDRESIEEGGFRVIRKRLFAYKEIDNVIETPRSKRKGYPKIAYMPLYVSVNEKDELIPPEGDEIIESGTYPLDEARKILKREDFIIAREGLLVARRARRMRLDII